MEVDGGEVDEKLYSRQLYVLGREGQAKMSNASVLICGLNGLGAEVAKNVILAGPKAVALFDDTPTAFRDLGGNPYLAAADVGAPRAAACGGRLGELNPYVAVTVMGCGVDAASGAAGGLHSGDAGEWAARARGYSVVCLCDAASDAELVAASAGCRAAGARLVAGEARGVCAGLFCDFGDEWRVADADGEPGVSCNVASIANTSPALVTVVDEARHGLEAGDVVAFASCVGMPSLNGHSYAVTRVASPYAYEIDFDAERAGAYQCWNQSLV